MTRRSVLATAGATLVGTMAATGAATAQETPEFDGWFAETGNYDGIVDETGSSTVTVSVGPADVDGGPYAFGPAAIRVDPGTTVVWEWTGNGGSHDVVASDGDFQSNLTDEAGHTFEHTFEENGVFRYYCTPHKAMGMRGAVVVGDVSVGDGADGDSESFLDGPHWPENETSQMFLLVVFGVMSVSAVIALLPDVPPAVRWAGRSIRRVGYGVHRRTGFRTLPVGSTAIGWLSFGTVLLAIGLVVLGLWIVGAGSIGFLLTLALIGLLVARYVTSRAGVGLIPARATGGGGSTVRTTSRLRSIRGADNTETEGRLELGRSLPVVRGWLIVALLLALGAAGFAGLWLLGDGPLGLLAGLLIVGIIAAAYAISSTR